VTSQRKARAALVVVFLVWGTTYLAMRIGLETFPPFLMASFRWIAAGTVLAVGLAVRGERLPPPRSWGSLAVLGVLLLGVGNGGVVWAEQYVPSGLTAVLVATTPFWLVGIDAAMPGGERLTLRRLVSLLVGFGGVAMLVWPEIRLDANGGFLRGVIAAQLACAGWAIGSTYARTRRHEENVLATVAMEMLFGGLFLLALGSFRHEWGSLGVNARTLAAVVYLAAFGSIAGFSAYAYALKHLPVATVSLYAYVNPVIAVVLGTLLLHEPFSWRMCASAAIVLSGIALVRNRR
jgi:drug/metabolite transporter (DMT)-like permease